MQGLQNERLREAQMANTNSLQGVLANNANFYKAFGSRPDVIRYKDSRGSYSDQATFKGMVRENTLANKKVLEAQLKNAEANVANEQRAAERSQQDFLKRNPGLEELRAYMSTESDLISEKLWPALKATLAELKTMLAAADPENTTAHSAPHQSHFKKLWDPTKLVNASRSITSKMAQIPMDKDIAHDKS